MTWTEVRNKKRRPRRDGELMRKKRNERSLEMTKRNPEDNLEADILF
jgi:hypothetical protein